MQGKKLIKVGSTNQNHAVYIIFRFLENVGYVLKGCLISIVQPHLNLR